MSLKNIIIPGYKSNSMQDGQEGAAMNDINADAGIVKIGITGSAGSGKSLVCSRLRQKGIVTLDCDQIARQVVEPGTQGFKKIAAQFRPEVAGKDGRLDRAVLRRMIINEPELKKKLENIVHPLVLEEMIFQMDNAECTSLPVVAVEVPLLFESGMDAYFDVTLAVVSEKDELVNRICERDGVNACDAMKMLGIQMSQKKKTALADHVIINTGTVPELFESVDYFLNKIKKEFLTT
jgi:dephospho-CoA kinase